jgi:hypothetical protein
VALKDLHNRIQGSVTSSAATGYESLRRSSVSRELVVHAEVDEISASLGGRDGRPQCSA